MIHALIIDQRTEISEEIARLLHHVEREDFQPTCVLSIEDGIEKLSHQAFDAAVVQLDAAGENCDQLRHLKDLAPMLPVVILCANEARDEAIATLDDGAEDYVEEGHLSGEVLARSIQYAMTRVDTAAKLAFLSRADPLTGLVNRSVFRERTEQAMARAERTGNPGALLLIDLDSFQSINETYGNATGDLLLQHVGAQLQSIVRPYDVVARLGGDDFALLFEDVANAHDARSITERVLAAIARPLDAENPEIMSTASIGAALFPTNGSDPSSLLRNASFALDRAKREGGNVASFYMDVFGGSRGPWMSAAS